MVAAGGRPKPPESNGCDSIRTMPDDTTPHRPTLMTVHAHPDDETIGTGGVMAKTVADGHRLVLVTCTRGEMGDIVVPDLDTPDNHRRLGEIRAGELEAAMGELGVTEWENLGYRDSDMMGRVDNLDPRSFWQADLDEAARRLVFLIRRHRPDVVSTYNEYGGYGHPDHIRTHDVAVRAFERAGDPKWYPEQLENGLEPWAPSKLYIQAIPRSVREKMNEKMVEMGQKAWWTPPDDATPEQIAEFEEFASQMLVPDEMITTGVDVSGAPLDAKWAAIHEHVTQISDASPFMVLGYDGWRDGWGNETYILQESRVESPIPETDLFAGIV